MKPTKYCSDRLSVPPVPSGPPVSPPASSVSDHAALHSPLPGRSRYLPMMLSSVWRRMRLLFPSASLPTYWLPTIDSDPFGRHWIWPPPPGASLKRPYDCQPLISHGSILSLSDGKIWTRTPLKNQGVFDDT